MQYKPDKLPSLAYCCMQTKSKILVLHKVNCKTLIAFIYFLLKENQVMDQNRFISHIVTYKYSIKENPYCNISVSFLTASCCYADFTVQLARSPVIKISNSYWNRCGQLSKP